MFVIVYLQLFKGGIMTEEELEGVKRIYASSLVNKDLKKIENRMYNTTNDSRKVQIELARLSNYLKSDVDMYKDNSYAYYNILKKYKKYLVEPNDELLQEIKNEIVNLELECNIQVAMVSIFKKYIDEINNKNIMYEDSMNGEKYCK